MSSRATKHFRSYRPLRQRIDKHRAALQKLGFGLVEGSDEGWFGDGRYVFGAGAQLLRITRSRGEEFVELALQRRSEDEQWFDLFELLTAFGVLTSRDVLDGRAMAHDLDSKLPAYIELSAKINAELARDQAALERRLQQARADGQRAYSERIGSKGNE